MSTARNRCAREIETPAGAVAGVGIWEFRVDGLAGGDCAGGGLVDVVGGDYGDRTVVSKRASRPSGRAC